MTSRVRRPAMLLASALTLAVTSCGGGDAEESGEESGNAETPKPAASASAPATSPAPADGDADTPAAGSPEPGLRPAPGDLVNFACTQNAKGVWKAEGDLRNSTTAPMVYRLTVVTVQSGVVDSHAEVEFVLAPDESTGFELPRLARGSVDSCMPRVVRGPR